MSGHRQHNPGDRRMSSKIQHSSSCSPADIPRSPLPDGPRSENVELATLSLPRSAIEAGLEVGEGNHVVLEASSETIEHLQQAMAAAAVVVTDNDDGMTTGGSTTLTGSNSNHTERPSISAVVDLEKLSELVGATEVDLITGLQQEMQERRALAAEKEGEEASSFTETTTTPDEETPLVAKLGRESAQVFEPATATEQITLLADPFLETLAEVLPTIPEHEAAAITGESSLYGEALTVATTTIAVNDVMAGGVEGHEECGHQHEEQHFAHDAFLLDVPTTDEQGNLEHHFVLALPEILLEESVQTVSSALSHDGSFHLMERALSFLPSTTRLPTDIENVHLEATEHNPTKADPSQVHIDVVINRRVPVVGYIILFSGLLALASVGAALDLQKGGVTSTMKTLWRQMSTSIFLLPLVIKSFSYDGIPNLTFAQWSILPIASAAYAYMALAFVVSLEMTTMANAFVLSNMTSLVIIFGRFVLGMPVLPLEGSGAITGFFGAAICAQDAARTVAAGGAGVSTTVSSNSINPHLGMLGNIIALSASFGTAAYLLIAKKLRPKMDLFVFMFIIMSCGSILLLLFIIASGEEMTFDRNPVHGIFGWMNLQADRLPLELFLVIICNCLGTTGYIAVMKYFDPLVPATVMLLEPAIGGLLGVATGTAKLPGLQTWLGNLVVAGGTFLVIYSGSNKKESIDATEALRPRTGGDILGDEAGTKESDSFVIKSPLLPRRSPTMSKSPRKQSSDDSAGTSNSNGTNTMAKVVWEVE
ncbi:EamA-like transporter family protein [Nitzschia inconspicua]|uniref:EamA-like transporter family protein n=1 Tax=Nitzschia inconspicua TaxID=303405 RepID=A0A9K3KPI1_9STRA|nr:EamA-like transporter family protein [Nitzschia inconspicua]